MTTTERPERSVPKPQFTDAEAGAREFPDSSAAKGKKGEAAKEVELSPEQIAFAQITQGIHW